MKAAGDVEDLLEQIKGGFQHGPKPIQEDRNGRGVAGTISVQGDAVIATSVHIDTIQTRGTSLPRLDTITASQATRLAIVANEMATECESVDDILTWVAAKFGVHGYLSIPAADYDVALAYLDTKAAETVRVEVNHRSAG